jgi:DNA mismatch repair protein MutS2
MKRRIEGVVHGASSSGQTLFVEPMETIERNNELVALREQEAQEVHRILQEMTRRLRERSAELDAAADAVTVLDVAFAKGGFAVEFDAVIPTLGGGRLRLHEARHPVLQDVLRARRAAVIPMSMDLDRENHVLVISGPNTGGKTVALKTAGLLALAAQAGIPVTAAEAEFPVFDQVLADIGDYQSIEANLSTFSSHLTNIEAMIERVTPDSLVLLDELGGATDPQEGGALAVAIVEHFLNSGAFTIASTHHLALKAFATNTAGVLNASVGFDEQTLQPTYRLLLGVPGKSSGIAIAQRLGLKPEVLERARQALTTQDEEVGRLLGRLHESVEEADRLRDEVRRLEQSLREQTKTLAATWEKREKSKLAELEKQLAAALARMEEEARAALQQIADKQARKEAERAAAKARTEARENFDAAVVETLGAQTQPSAPAPLLELKEGVAVRLRSLGRTGVVRRRISDDLWEVEMGLLKMRVARADLEAVAVQPAPMKLPVHVTLEAGPPAAQEINVIGCTAEEALERVDKFLDSAVVALLPRVRVVHGHGKNILKNALAKMLGSHPQVERYFPAEAREGGSGATIVELKI